MVGIEHLFLVSLMAGCATGLGAVPILFKSGFSHRIFDSAVGFAGGVMVGAAFFNLILPGIDIGGIPEVLAGFFVGGGGF